MSPARACAATAGARTRYGSTSSSGTRRACGAAEAKVPPDTDKVAKLRDEIAEARRYAESPAAEAAAAAEALEPPSEP